MLADFYFNESDNNKINKSLKNKLATTITLINDTELVNPTITVRNFDIKDYNYLYIGGDIKRYYYITNVIRKQQYLELTLHCDVLMSFKDQILAQEVIVSRGYAKAKNRANGEPDYIYNMYLEDDLQKFVTQGRVYTKAFTGGFSKSCHYILAVQGGA